MYDPRADAPVRTEAAKLRSKLRSYYESEGREDRVIIAIPKGGYVPVFERRPAVPQPGSPESPTADPDAAPVPHRGRRGFGLPAASHDGAGGWQAWSWWRPA